MLLCHAELTSNEEVLSSLLIAHFEKGTSVKGSIIDATRVKSCDNELPFTA